MTHREASTSPRPSVETTARADVDALATITQLETRVEQLQTAVRRLEKRINRHVAGRKEFIHAKRNHR